ncbi:MAG: thiamine pyrophosphate-binding protein [Thermoanaerobaculales bacterium]|jgi:acetolactate synthase-1/2/3 large subunit|nr:thiamine pyrophosphate-binding protein [Thermoanaerobaculales bacterium]
MKLRGSRLVVRALVDEGVRFTFGIPGTHNIELYDALEEAPGIEAVLVTSEVAGAFMGDGVSRTSDQIGVLNVVPGAGVTHSLSGIAEAFMDQVPLVVLACGIRRDTGTAFQLHDIDQLAVLRPVTKAAFAIAEAAEIYPTIRRAFEIARTPPAGPVAVEIPANLMMLTQEVDEPRWAASPPPERLLDRELVERAARMLGEAHHPAIYAGVGAVAGRHQLIQLAEQLGAPVMTTFQGKGVFPESHPLWLWTGIGRSAPPFVRAVVDRCDCLLAVGCRFGEVATGSYGLAPPRRLIHVDIDPEVPGRNFPTELAVTADAATFLGALGALIEGRRPADELVREIADGHERVRRSWRGASSPSRVTPERFFAVLQRHCGDDTVYATDSGNGTFLAAEHLRLDHPRCFIGPVDFSCMGYSVPASIGAAFANPHRDVVTLAGDGAFLMTGLEALTAATYGAAPLICVLRDGKHGLIAEFQKVPLNRQTCSVLPDYSVQAVAEAVGCRYFRILRDSELEAVIPAALELVRARTPAIVEVAIDYSNRTFFSRGVVATNFWRFPWRERLRMLGRALLRRMGG